VDTLLPDVLRRHAAERPAHAAVVTGDRRLGYAEFWSQACRLANALKSRGVRRGDRVAIFMDNVLACPVALFGSWLADAVTVAVNAQTKTDKLAWILKDSGAVMLLSEHHLARVYDPAIAGSTVRAVLASTEGGAAPAGSEDLEAVVRMTPEGPPETRNIAFDLAAILYTSGTTGDPKGVMHTHASLAFTRDSVVEYLGLRGEDRLLCALPLSFGYGLFQLLPATAVGATLVLERNFTYPAEIFPRMQLEAVTTVAGVPTVFAMMLAHDEKHAIRFPSVRIVTNAAAALPEEFIPGIQRIFPSANLVKMYGQTECIRACYLPPALAARHPGSVGIAIPGTELLLLDVDGREVPVGETGTLHVRGPNVMRGYWNDPARTGASLVPAPVPGEVMLRTGDQFRRDAEGLLHFVARQDDIIKSRGEKVSPTEVENAIYRLPAVAEAMVLGVPDPMLGQAVCALVTLKPGSSLQEKQVKRACSERLEGYMVPKRVLFVDALPRTPNGKLSRALAAERFKDELAVVHPTGHP
jgi:long-chain acyl-CoA synthetase